MNISFLLGRFVTSGDLELEREEVAKLKFPIKREGWAHFLWRILRGKINNKGDV